jgi:hypothetical protein
MTTATESSNEHAADLNWGGGQLKPAHLTSSVLCSSEMRDTFDDNLDVMG